MLSLTKARIKTEIADSHIIYKSGMQFLCGPMAMTIGEALPTEG